MLQQFKSMDSKYGPIMELARRVQEQTGITDPNQIANAMGEGMLQMLQAQQQGQADNNTAESPAVAEANSDPRVMQKNVQSDEQATQAAQEFFEENGLQPTDAAFKSMANIFKYSTAIEQAATILPTLMEVLLTCSSNSNNKRLCNHNKPLLMLKPLLLHKNLALMMSRPSMICLFRRDARADVPRI